MNEMARNEEGEFELVLGNRQLLSVFFILMVLMGVFFAMGYIVGRNNPSKEAAEIAARRESIDANAADKRGSIIVDPNATKPSAVTEKPAEAPKPAESKSVEMPKPIETKPAELPKAEPPKPVETKQAEKKKPEEKKAVEKPKPVEKPRPVEVAAGGAPAPGQTFLQVIATDKATCDAIVDTLRKKSYHAMTVPGPSEKIFRVIVGPLADQAAVAKTKIELEGIGFKGAYVRKY
jgi:cell division septation protein DedD